MSGAASGAGPTQFVNLLRNLDFLDFRVVEILILVIYAGTDTCEVEVALLDGKLELVGD